MNPKPEIKIRRALPEDGDALISLVIGLAHYENLTPPALSAQRRLIEDAFGAKKRFDVLLAEVEGCVAGGAIFFETYSTFAARPKLYLEDLFVKPEFRGLKVGQLLIKACAREARGRGCLRMEWAVLDWNEPAIGFYEGLGAEREDTWHVYSLSEDGLQKLDEGE